MMEWLALLLCGPKIAGWVHVQTSPEPPVVSSSEKLYPLCLVLDGCKKQT